MSLPENRRKPLLTFVLIVLVLLLALLWLGREIQRALNAPTASHGTPMTPVVVVTPLAPPLPEKIPAPIPPVKNISPPIPMKHQKPMAVTPTPPATVPYHPYVPPPLTPPPAEPQAWSGTDTSITHDGQIIVHTEEQWIHFWTEHHPDEAAPEVDFAHDMVIGVFVGARPADQFAVTIVGIRTQPDSLIVDYRERNPPTGTFAMGVTVYPYALKVIPHSALRVKFNKLLPEQP